MLAVPDAPSYPEVSEIRKDSCKLTWEEPKNNGGKPVKHYLIERRVDGSTRWIRLKERPAITSLTIGDLSQNHKYEFRVFAENSVGVSESSDNSNVFVAKDPWGKFLQLILFEIFNHFIKIRYTRKTFETCHIRRPFYIS